MLYLIAITKPHYSSTLSISLTLAANICKLLRASTVETTQQSVAAVNQRTAEAILSFIRWHRLAMPLSRQINVLAGQDSISNLPATGNNWQPRVQAIAKRENIQLLGQQAELVKLHALFKQHGLPFIVFKGVAFSSIFQQTDARRHSKDIDIWLEPQTVYSAIEILQYAGYRLASAADVSSEASLNRLMLDRKDLVFRSPHNKTVELELHWRLDKNKFAHSLSFTDALAQAASLELGSISIPVFSLEQYVAYLPIHGGLAMWGRLKWLLDWYYVLQECEQTGFDWSSHLAKLQAAGVLQPTLLAMTLCEKLFDSQLPLAAKTFPQSWACRIAQRKIIESMQRQSYPNLLIRWLLRLVIISRRGYRYEQCRLLFKAVLHPALRK